MVIETALLYDNDARNSPGLKRMFRLWLSERPAVSLAVDPSHELVAVTL
jgi:hypothetical protein